MAYGAKWRRQRAVLLFALPKVGWRVLRVWDEARQRGDGPTAGVVPQRPRRGDRRRAPTGRLLLEPGLARPSVRRLLCRLQWDLLLGDPVLCLRGYPCPNKRDISPAARN